MRYIVKNMKANTYKIIHSKLLWIHIGMPFIAVLIFGAYYSYSPWLEEDKIMVYFQAITMGFPLMIAIVTTLLYELDFKAGKFQCLLSVPCSKVVAHLGNLLPLIMLGLLSTLFSIVGFGIVFQLMGFKSFGLGMFVEIAVVIFVANIAVYILQYVLCYTFGKGVSLGIGIIGTLLSPLLYLGLGDNIWRYIPCSYGIRLSSYDFMSNIQNKEAFNRIAEDFRTGGIVVTIITFLLIALFLIWSKMWQGTMESAE